LVAHLTKLSPLLEEEEEEEQGMEAGAASE